MWSISELKNTVKISKKCAKDLFENGQEYVDELWSEIDYVTDDNGCLYFNSDHNEHMDFLHSEKILNILNKHKVKGEICFGSLEGDNAGSFWGYRFDGKGKMKLLNGEIVWK